MQATAGCLVVQMLVVSHIILHEWAPPLRSDRVSGERLLVDGVLDRDWMSGHRSRAFLGDKTWFVESLTRRSASSCAEDRIITRDPKHGMYPCTYFPDCVKALRAELIQGPGMGKEA